MENPFENDQSTCRKVRDANLAFVSPPRNADRAEFVRGSARRLTRRCFTAQNRNIDDLQVRV